MPEYSSIRDKIRKISTGELSLPGNISYFLQHIEEYKHLNCYNSVFAADAMQKAAETEFKIRNGTGGRLAGCVVSVKDVIALKNKPLTCSSKILQNYISLYTASAIQKLIDEDAIIIGKTNCDEFAMGSSNENSAFGRVLNPVNTEHVPGGSSGGSAAALKSGLCDISIGTDTGGSVRQPAAFCGVYGLKPTYGRISRYGLTAFASSFDTMGIFANNPEDAAILLEVMSGHDPMDSTSALRETESFSSGINLNQNIKIGIPIEYMQEEMDEDIKQRVLDLSAKFKNAGFPVVNISLPHTKYALAAYYVITTAEASSNLSRYDGVRYGYRSQNFTSLKEMYVDTRTEGFGNEVKRRIMLGTFVLSAGYYDSYYKKAQKVRRLIQQDFINAFRETDIILSPSAPSPAFRLAEKTKNPVEMYLSDIFTTPASLAGIPAMNIPYGLSRNKLPTGLQLMSAHFNEKLLLKTAEFIKNNFPE